MQCSSGSHRGTSSGGCRRGARVINWDVAQLAEDQLDDERVQRDVEDLVEMPVDSSIASASGTVSGLAGDLHSLELVEEGVVADLKAELMALICDQVELQFRNNEMDIDEDEVKSAALLALEMGSVDTEELYTNSSHRKRTEAFQIRPGFVLDI